MVRAAVDQRRRQHRAGDSRPLRTAVPVHAGLGTGQPDHRHRLVRHFWSTCVGAGRAAEGLRASWQEHLRTVAGAAGFRYVRFHGLLHDDMFVHRRIEVGSTVLNFQYVDGLSDRTARRMGGPRPAPRRALAGPLRLLLRPYRRAGPPSTGMRYST
ncbi:hypothetical protein PV364_36665 [Streptomyces sp. MI02-7b]|nr:hypothetical protein [Streptomyces sp. MI02-7b]